MESIFILLHIALSVIYSYRAQENTCSVRGEPAYPQLWKNGDIIVGGIFPFHSKWENTDPSYSVMPPAMNCTR